MIKNLKSSDIIKVCSIMEYIINIYCKPTKSNYFVSLNFRKRETGERKIMIVIFCLGLLGE